MTIDIPITVPPMTRAMVNQRDQTRTVNAAATTRLMPACRRDGESVDEKMSSPSKIRSGRRLEMLPLKMGQDDRPPDGRPSPRASTPDEYTFGDAGSQWRMTRLKAVYALAHDTGRSVEEIAMERYGDLRRFDEAREEEVEVDRRATYGASYVGKVKASGDLYAERQLDRGESRRAKKADDGNDAGDLPQGEIMPEAPPSMTTAPLDATALNRLKAQMMKAKLKGAPDAAGLEAAYHAAVAGMPNRNEPEVIVLGARESRMLAGGARPGPDHDGESMTIAEMVREERMTRGQAGGEGRRFAQRIAKDGQFADDLDYLDENAAKLARRVHRSEIDLKHMAIGDLQTMNRVLDQCPLCHHEERQQPPAAPVVALATRVYLTLATEPELSAGSACIVPIQHRRNLLECDDDEWEEIRNFMKCLTRMYHDQGRAVIFYENAARPQRRPHAAMHVVPLPPHVAADVPAFFKEAILASDEEWTQHAKIIDTRLRAGGGKHAFRRSIAKEMPYFHVWLELDGGLGHVVDDEGRWPPGDRFARETVGGMLDLPPDTVRRPGRWTAAAGRCGARVDAFRQHWTPFDWTALLTDAGV
ncbi:MAG: hypothetical protein M1826_001221 [Phylliscum demangeonii]|nr:MAG: hypothetical protein M1826_001221 [Phylliscum demangeonii]